MFLWQIFCVVAAKYFRPAYLSPKIQGYICKILGNIFCQYFPLFLYQGWENHPYFPEFLLFQESNGSHVGLLKPITLKMITTWKFISGLMTSLTRDVYYDAVSMVT